MSSFSRIDHVSVFLLSFAMAAVLAGCSHRPAVVVGTKPFTEQHVLGEIICKLLEREEIVCKPLDKQSAAQTGNRKIIDTVSADKLLRDGTIDLYPEYTGTALEEMLNLSSSHDAQTDLDLVKRAYQKDGLEWLAPLGFSDDFALIIRKEEETKKITTLTQAAKYERGWVMGVMPEFLTRRGDGIAALREVYQIPLARPVQAMDFSEMYRALTERRVDLIVGNSTDGALRTLSVRQLDDDKNFFPHYMASIVVRRDALDRNPKLLEALNKLSGAISRDDMQRMNWQVDVEGDSAQDVARDFLARHKF
jgi:glycine betaine/choline ABC-type transport system substrate-binding protein